MRLTREGCSDGCKHSGALKLGFFIQPVHPPLRSYADVLREDREAVVLADRLGYREAFIGEHRVDSAETITSSLAFIASLADACPSITFGTGVLPLANYHPAMAAAQVAMVDHLVHGRFVLGVFLCDVAPWRGPKKGQPGLFNPQPVRAAWRAGLGGGAAINSSPGYKVFMNSTNASLSASGSQVPYPWPALLLPWWLTVVS